MSQDGSKIKRKEVTKNGRIFTNDATLFKDKGRIQ